MMSSSSEHRDEIQWGTRALNSRKSPGRIGTATPSVGKQKCTTTGSSTLYDCVPPNRTCATLRVKSSSVWHRRKTFRPNAMAPKYFACGMCVYERWLFGACIVLNGTTCFAARNRSITSWSANDSSISSALITIFITRRQWIASILSAHLSQLSTPREFLPGRTPKHLYITVSSGSQKIVLECPLDSDTRCVDSMWLSESYVLSTPTLGRTDNADFQGINVNVGQPLEEECEIPMKLNCSDGGAYKWVCTLSTFHALISFFFWVTIERKHWY